MRARSRAISISSSVSACPWWSEALSLDSPQRGFKPLLLFGHHRHRQGFVVVGREQLLLLRADVPLLVEQLLPFFLSGGVVLGELRPQAVLQTVEHQIRKLDIPVEFGDLVLQPVQRHRWHVAIRLLVEPSEADEVLVLDPLVIRWALQHQPGAAVPAPHRGLQEVKMLALAFALLPGAHDSLNLFEEFQWDQRDVVTRVFDPSVIHHADVVATRQHLADVPHAT